MIERNLGNIERILRLVAGIMLAIWAVSRPNLNSMEWFIVIISLFLILNGVFGRCYLWFVLNLNSCVCKNIALEEVTAGDSAAAGQTPAAQLAVAPVELH